MTTTNAQLAITQETENHPLSVWIDGVRVGYLVRLGPDGDYMAHHNNGNHVGTTRGKFSAAALIAE